LVQCDLAVEVGRRCVDKDPTMPLPRDSLAIAYLTRGKVQAALGRTGDALASFEAERALAAQLARTSPANLNFVDREANACLNVGHMRRARGESAPALEAYRCVLAAAARVGDRSPSFFLRENAIWARFDAAKLEIKLGQARAGRDDVFTALAELSRLGEVPKV